MLSSEIDPKADQEELLQTIGHVHSFESLGCVDGPGLRFIVFLQGCPLRCQYCHNPDCRDPRGGKLMSVAAVLEEISHHAAFIKHGGITLSGGEPLLQSHFAAKLLKACQERGWHTALDTSGFCQLEQAKAVLAATDLVLLDIKHFHPKRYQALTHVDLDSTLRFADELARLKKPFWLRYVLVPGWTDHEEDIKALAQYAAGFDNLERIDVLPFHKMGESKWEAMGYPYLLKATPSPDQDLIDRVVHWFQASGKPVFV